MPPWERSKDILRVIKNILLRIFEKILKILGNFLIYYASFWKSISAEIRRTILKIFLFRPYRRFRKILDVWAKKLWTFKKTRLLEEFQETLKKILGEIGWNFEKYMRKIRVILKKFFGKIDPPPQTTPRKKLRKFNDLSYLRSSCCSLIEFLELVRSHSSNLYSESVFEWNCKKKKLWGKFEVNLKKFVIIFFPVPLWHRCWQGHLGRGRISGVLSTKKDITKDLSIIWIWLIVKGRK